MSANIYATPYVKQSRVDIETWRPSSFWSHLEERFGRASSYRVTWDNDLAWLHQLAREMGEDGGGNSEATQVIKMLRMYGAVLLEIEG